MNGIERIAVRFDRLAQREEAALIPYFVAGYPDLKATREQLWQAYEAGVNLVELGIPFSDPVADGPTIQRAIQHSLGHGTTPRKCVDLVAGMRKEGFDLPILGMTYANLLHKGGFLATARRWGQAGLDGAIVPDISVEDAGPFRVALRKAGLGTVFFAAPSTTMERARHAMDASTAFLYLVAVYGTTGSRGDVASSTVQLLRRVQRERGRDGSPPVCVGFGVSKPRHVATLRAAGADGVIVGSALVDAIDRHDSLRNLLKDLKRATVSRS